MLSTDGHLPLLPAPGPYPQMRLLLGDQLDPQHSWFAPGAQAGVLYVMMEILPEQHYVQQHRQKLLLFLQAMRAFALALQQQGHALHYLALDDPENQQSFTENLRMLIQRYGATRLAYQLPDEYRLVAAFEQLPQALGLPVEALESEHFLTHRQELQQLMGTRSHWRMESFYHYMRRKTGMLMQPDGEPQGGRWNYDSENRQGPRPGLQPPTPPRFTNDYGTVRQSLDRMGVRSFGRDSDPLLPVTRAQSQLLLAHFVAEALPDFGTYQDAMMQQQPLLYHSLISFSLNIKLLRPLEVLQAVLEAYETAPSRYPLAGVEGYVRQILGWREYMRGVYWAQMPGYAEGNYLQHHRPLPGWYWTGDTRMNCLRQSIQNSLDHAYAHHIQRLMVTGSFAALAGIAPAEVNAWYLGIYADAIAWVQLPNTQGMSLYADGGLIATKPYISGGAYLKRMSDYCKGCAYDVNQRTGPRACPFNSLYWHFLDRHSAAFGRNPRMATAYRTWERLGPDTQAATRAQAEQYLAALETL